MERRLAAIMAADMVGFSRLMEVDEMGTLTRQKRHRAELIDPKIDQHGGKIIKLTGDGMIVEFPSVVEAVQCAVSVQQEMAVREADSPKDSKICYRIAVNLGDVIFNDEDNDVYGDGVNIAARLEELAPPGGVIVSGTAFDHLKTNIDVGYVDLGERQVKNIAIPVRAYQVVPEGHAELTRPAAQARRSRPVAAIVGAAATVLVVAGIAVWQVVLAPKPIDTPLAEDAPILAMPEGPKIVVLPFENLSGDPEQDYFVDGLTDDLINRLTEHRYLFVIGRSTAFSYKKKSPDSLTVGRDLGVDYFVEGRIRKSASRIRITAQLQNAKDGTQIWAKTYERALSVADVFEIQDALAIDISEAIGGTRGVITQKVVNAVSARPPKDLASFECVLLADNYWNTFDPKTNARARDCLEASVKRDPTYAKAWGELSGIYRAQYEQGLDGPQDPLKLAETAANTAIRLDPDGARPRLFHSAAM